MRYGMWKKIAGLLIASILVLANATAVFAIADPDSPLVVDAVNVYENVLEDGDTAILIRYFIDYAVPPTETATEAFFAVLIDVDGTTQIRSAAPFAYPAADYGYGHGVIWMYFDAADTATYTLDAADKALYSIWFMGNPTLAWAGDPPKTVTTIDDWQTLADPSTIIAVKILQYGQELGDAWGFPLVEQTSIGNRLTTVGEVYFQSAIPNLRDIAPGAFSAGIIVPTPDVVDYSRYFGATMEDGTGTVTGSVITLVEGVNSVDVTVAGTFLLELAPGTRGTVTNNTGTVTGSPVTIVAGINTITVPGGGTGLLDVTVGLVTTQTQITDSVIGTGWDMTTLATRFGMTRMWLSTLVWGIVSILICAAAYSSRKVNGTQITVLFCVCLLLGGVLGMFDLIVLAGIAACFVLVIVYYVFIKHSSY